MGAQKSLLVGIQNGNKAALGNVQALTQQIDANQHIKHAQAQITNDGNALQCVNVRMKIAGIDAALAHILTQFLRHALGERGDQRALSVVDDLAQTGNEIIHLRGCRPHMTHGIHQSCGAHDLFNTCMRGLLTLPCGGGGGDKNSRRTHAIPFGKHQRTIVHARGQAKAMRR